MTRNLVPSTWMKTVGKMLSEEPAPEPATINSCANRSAGVLTGALPQATQTRLGSDVAPSQLNRRGSALTLAWPIRAWLGTLRENDPSTVPSRGAWLKRKLAAVMLAACGMFCGMM